MSSISSARRAAPLRRAWSLAAALALVACSPDSSRHPLAPPTQVLSTANVALPLHGTVDMTTKSMQPLGPSSAFAYSEGTGTATHLGRFTASSDLTVDFATLAGISRWTLTAANGDVLTATTTGQATPNSDGVTPTVVESATITGGTGRFAGATGSFRLECSSNQATGVSTGSFDGIITLAK